MLTVSQLIEHLQKQPQDAPVLISTFSDMNSIVCQNVENIAVRPLTRAKGNRFYPPTPQDVTITCVILENIPF